MESSVSKCPPLSPARPGGPILVVALSGLGKSTLVARHPTRVLDADEFLYAAVADGFPTLKPRARLRAWRDLCRRAPWTLDEDVLRQWASIRRAWVEPFVASMRGTAHRLVVTSLLNPPWVVAAFYGLKRGHYMRHLRQVGRVADNRQSEAMNDRLEAYSPLVRLPTGSFIADRPEIRAVIRSARAGD